VFKFIHRDGGQNGHRIDRSNWVYEPNKVTDGYYYDSHSIRPFTNYSDELNKLVDLVRDDGIIDGYSTHLPILKSILEYATVNTVVEFGPGMHSTSMFADDCCNFMSVEMQSIEWFNTVNALHGHKPNVNIIQCISPTDFMYLKYPENIDLVFVDGHGDSRPGVINFFGSKCDVIVTHDTEEPGYRWDRVNLPSVYHTYKSTRYSPHTTIYTKDIGLIEYLKSKQL
jgi:hypothetical protein